MHLNIFFLLYCPLAFSKNLVKHHNAWRLARANVAPSPNLVAAKLAPTNPIGSPECGDRKKKEGFSDHLTSFPSLLTTTVHSDR